MKGTNEQRESSPLFFFSFAAAAKLSFIALSLLISQPTKKHQTHRLLAELGDADRTTATARA
jgi:hypothetical protein